MKKLIRQIKKPIDDKKLEAVLARYLKDHETVDLMQVVVDSVHKYARKETKNVI